MAILPSFFIKRENSVIASADGKIVIIQEVEENEFLKERCIQISTFMSIFNVHVNYFPVGGKILNSKHHQGKYLVAYYPKASEKNERTSIAVETLCGKRILFRQIAGVMARRIICHVDKGAPAKVGEEFGLIRFGSRVDFFFPIDSEINVKIGDKVKGKISVLAHLK